MVRTHAHKDVEFPKNCGGMSGDLNLVRAVMYAAAAQSGIAPRGYSFARVRHVVEHFLPFIAAAQTPEEAQALTDKMMECVGQKKLRNRKGRRSYPRAVWGRPRTFPSRKAETVIRP